MSGYEEMGKKLKSQIDYYVDLVFLIREVKEKNRTELFERTAKLKEDYEKEICKNYRKLEKNRIDSLSESEIKSAIGIDSETLDYFLNQRKNGKLFYIT